MQHSRGETNATRWNEIGRKKTEFIYLFSRNTYTRVCDEFMKWLSPMICFDTPVYLKVQFCECGWLFDEMNVERELKCSFCELEQYFGKVNAGYETEGYFCDCEWFFGIIWLQNSTYQLVVNEKTIHVLGVNWINFCDNGRRIWLLEWKVLYWTIINWYKVPINVDK